MEAERSVGRRKRRMSTGQGVVIGVATVAGLGLLTKLVSFLRRDEKPQKLDDADIETLEAVLSGDAAKGALPPTTAEVHIFANLENDEPSHEQDDQASVPDHEQARAKETPHSNGEGPIGLDTEEKEKPAAVGELDSEDGEQQHLPAADVVELHSGDEGKPGIEDAVELHTGDEAKQLNGDVLGEASP